MPTTFAIIAMYLYRENYGAHSWDGKGECPSYWKNKGSHEVTVSTGLSANTLLQLGSKGIELLIQGSELGYGKQDNYVEYVYCGHEIVELSPTIYEQVMKVQVEQMSEVGCAIEASHLTGLTEYQCQWAFNQ